MLVVTYALTMFVSASLLFVVQPMVAKLLLPSLGGSSAVWTTCMLFFQAMLLAGYLYAHLGARALAPRTQALVHLPLMLVAAVSLPIALPELAIDASARPTAWLLAALTLAVGLPFFVVSTTAPLLQHWFAHTGHRDAEDPYFLYAASNLGSMAALLGYPFLIEPALGVRAQTQTWAIVYGVFVVLVLVSARYVAGIRTSLTRHSGEQADVPKLTWAQRGRWIALAAVPSSLMLGLTQYLTTDIAAVPLLWVLPLALYLLTFILVFGRRPIWLPDIARTVLPVVTAAVFIATAVKVEMWVSILLHLGNFMLVALFFHGTLAQERPHAARLTEYFLLLSIGGAVGGLFNALVAPALFDRAIDYHLVMFVGLGCIRPAAWRIANPHGNRWLIPTLMTAVGGLYLYAHGFWSLTRWHSMIGAVCFLLAFFILGAWRPRFENAAFAFLLALGAQQAMVTQGLVTYERSFFAAYKVYEREYKEAGRFRKLSHGTTVHGAQSLDPNKASVPVSYHHPDGPVGQVLEAIPHTEVLVVGLGAGAMAAYAHEGVHFDIFEIDPLVHELATKYFTYLETCGTHCTVAIGDGRRLIEESRKKWDIIFLDAYNSDAVPTHLLTREALDIYLAKLNPGGVIVFHVSNRYLDIEGVVGAVAADAGVVSVRQLHNPPLRERKEKHIDRSKYAVVARTDADLRSMAENPEVWEPTWRADVVWTDDFTNVLNVFEW